MSEHCCPTMVYAIRADGLPVTYSPQYRQYGITYQDGSSQRIHFCPWCGRKLPESLGDTWFERIWSMGLEPEDDLPEAMLSDQWWKDEGL